MHLTKQLSVFVQFLWWLIRISNSLSEGTTQRDFKKILLCLIKEASNEICTLDRFGSMHSHTNTALVGGVERFATLIYSFCLCVCAFSCGCLFCLALIKLHVSGRSSFGVSAGTP